MKCNAKFFYASLVTIGSLVGVWISFSIGMIGKTIALTEVSLVLILWASYSWVILIRDHK